MTQVFPYSITLIGGSGRSGTTLLRRLMGRHEDVCEVPEWRLPVDPGGLADFYVSVTGVWTPLTYDAQYRRLATMLKAVGPKNGWQRTYLRFINAVRATSCSSFNLGFAYGAVDAGRFCPSYETLAEKLLCDLKNFSYRSMWTGTPWLSSGNTVAAGPFDRDDLAGILGRFYRDVVADTLRARHKEHYLEKNTWYPLVFDSFLKIVPEAKLICIHRDPRDVVLSMSQQRWAPQNLVGAAQYYRAIMDRWYAVRSMLPPGSYREVHFEDLVMTPETTLPQLADFAGIPLAKGPWHVNPGAIGRWEGRWSTAERQSVESFLHPELDAGFGCDHRK